MKRWISKSKLGWESYLRRKEGLTLLEPWLREGNQQCFIIEFQYRLPIITYICHIHVRLLDRHQHAGVLIPC